jgi:large subunit ribosomal protein L3
VLLQPLCDPDGRRIAGIHRSDRPQSTSAQARLREPRGTTESALRRARPVRSVRVRRKKTPAMATKAIVGEKVGMTQIWDEENRIVPVTVVRVAPCRVVQVKTVENDGYAALQVTFGQRDERKLNKPEAGHFAKSGVAPGSRLVELRLDDVSPYAIGQEISVDVLAAGDLVDVTAVSKGKGFAGVMKRHNFSGQKASHGVHRVHRMPGAIGACATPARVFRGTRMAGRMGNQKVTTQNLRVVQADPDNQLLLVKGAVPGPRGGLVLIEDAVKGGASR